jgi:hypothetical protein
VLKIEKYVLPSPEQWEMVIEGMRNPMNSWDKSDSQFYLQHPECPVDYCPLVQPNIGENDHKLMMSLNKGGTEHSKYRRMIPVWVDITAPLYWWKEADQYKISTVTNSCSTMHKIHAEPITMKDFSQEHLNLLGVNMLHAVVDSLEANRQLFLQTKDKRYWWQIIQLLPSSYNQRRTYFLNYAVLRSMYHARKHHKLDEWRVFCEWIETLPYAKELIIGGVSDASES